MTKEDNMLLWKKVAHTNPKYTKPFPSFGKTLTTIDPMYQIMTMTGTFGPVGEGWNYKVNYNYTDKCVFAEVSVAHKKEKIVFGITMAQYLLYKHSLKRMAH